MAELPIPAEFLTLRYMTRFKCLGSECEDTCCQGWRIALSEADFDRVRNALDTTPEDRQRFADGVRRNAESPHGADDHATLQKDELGRCAFLSADRLCSLHRDHGMDALPDICAVYPRRIGLVGRRIEQVGTFSCPEVARLALLADDAMELVELDPRALPRHRYAESLDPGEDDQYRWYFDDVRATILGLLTLADFPFATRLFLVTYFSHRLQPFFGRDRERFAEQRLQREVDRLADPRLLRELSRKFAVLDIPPALASRLTQQMIAARAMQGTSRTFAYLLTAAFASYVCQPEHVAQPAVRLTMEAVWQAYRQRAAYWERQHGDRIDRYFTNYAINYFMGDWYTASPMVLLHVRRLLVRLAIIRFLLFSDPALKSVASDAGEPDTPVREVLDRAVVRVVYNVSRAIEHNAAFLADVERSLDEQGIDSFAHVVCLLRF